MDDFLDITRIEAGRLEVKYDAVALRPIVSQLTTQLSSTYHSHSFTIDITDDFPEFQADTERLTQVLYNLLDNAAKYSPKGGPVAVSVRRDDGNNQAVIAVADKGMGIPETEMPQIFNRFHRIHRPETEGIRGTGLGLSIVKSLVEMMGGRIWAESQMDKGSTFYVALPLTETEHPGSSSP